MVFGAALAPRHRVCQPCPRPGRGTPPKFRTTTAACRPAAGAGVHPCRTLSLYTSFLPTPNLITAAACSALPRPGRPLRGRRFTTPSSPSPWLVGPCRLDELGALESVSRAFRRRTGLVRVYVVTPNRHVVNSSPYRRPSVVAHRGRADALDPRRCPAAGDPNHACRPGPAPGRRLLPCSAPRLYH